MTRQSKPRDIRAKAGPPSDSGAEDDDFARAMADVAPLKRDRPERVPIGTAAGLVSKPSATSRARPAHQVDRDALDDSAFLAPGVDRRELRRLKRGDYPIDGRYDLHGLTADEAVARVNRLIDRSRHARYRAVCIVHGRGLHSQGGVAVLKTRVRASLRAHRAVLAFADAPPADGGTGAMYVLLRR